MTIQMTPSFTSICCGTVLAYILFFFTLPRNIVISVFISPSPSPQLEGLLLDNRDFFKSQFKCSLYPWHVTYSSIRSVNIKGSSFVCFLSVTTLAILSFFLFYKRILFLFFYFIFKLYYIVLVLPYINMNPIQYTNTYIWNLERW